ncbi:MAG: hydratase, partial [Lachnospiraceae bacterium]|nr:hydratase [Lachnospiraceae bacterium]
QVVAEIHDPVTTTDELIPSGETSSYRSNPLGLAEFTLSRKDPGYVARAKEIRAAEQERVEKGVTPDEIIPELEKVYGMLSGQGLFVNMLDTMLGSVIFAVKPGDGSAREQAASCQKVLGGQANIALEYATKRYRSNLINWGMLPFIARKEDEDCYRLGTYVFVHGIRNAIENGDEEIKALLIDAEKGTCEEKILTLGALTDDERAIILKGCLINYYRNEDRTLKLFRRTIL